MKKLLSVRIKRRKNFLPALILAITFWLLWGWFVYSFPPLSNLLLITFFTLLFLAIFFTFALIFASSRIGLLIALWLGLFLVFRYLKIDNFLNLTLLTAIFLMLAGYFWKSRR